MSGRESAGPPPLTLEATSSARGVIVTLTGEVDVYTAPRLQHFLNRIIDNGAVEVVVDLQNAEFMDSSALNVLVAAFKRLSAAGGTMRLRGADEQAQTVLRITGLDKIIELET